MSMEEKKGYKVRQLRNDGPTSILVSVPGSKSITNRALLLAALAEGKSTLTGALFSNDSADLIRCLSDLGINIDADRKKHTITVTGCGGKIPVKEAFINVGSAGTAARFITALLAFSHGTYTLDASDQMKKRPMKPLLDALSSIGVKIAYLGEEGHFPFVLDSGNIHGNEISVDIGVSSQFLSGLLMAGVLSHKGLTVKLTGTRKSLPYVSMTASVMKSFGNLPVTDKEGTWHVKSGHYKACDYSIEPDMSAACYFFAMAQIMGISVKVNGVHRESLQGDVKFLDVLLSLGALITEDPGGLCVKGPEGYAGGHFNLNDFSDQALTLAAVALFAETPVTITGIGHIRKQESDRIEAIAINARALGAQVSDTDDSVTIGPGAVDRSDNVVIKTFSDHRVAMAFAIAGLRRRGVIIDEPCCVSKTFPEFFDLLTAITGGDNEY